MRFLTTKDKDRRCALFLAQRAVAFLIVASLVGCSGGGDGGGSGAPSSNAKGTALRILHGAIDAAPIDIYSDQKESKVGSAYFAESTFYTSIGIGPQNIKMVRANSLDQTVALLSLNPEKDSRHTLLLYGGLEKLGLSAALLQDHKPEIAEGSAAIRVIHALIGASAITATASDVSISGGTQFGSASSYIEVPAGSVDLKINRLADKKNVFSQTKVLAPNTFYTYFVTGEVDYFVTVKELVD